MAGIQDSLALNGQSLELDLSQKNDDKVHEFLALHVAAVRKGAGFADRLSG